MLIESYSSFALAVRGDANHPINVRADRQLNRENIQHMTTSPYIGLRGTPIHVRTMLLYTMVWDSYKNALFSEIVSDDVVDLMDRITRVGHFIYHASVRAAHGLTNRFISDYQEAAPLADRSAEYALSSLAEAFAKMVRHMDTLNALFSEISEGARINGESIDYTTYNERIECMLYDITRYSWFGDIRAMNITLDTYGPDDDDFMDDDEEYSDDDGLPPVEPVCYENAPAA